MTEGRSPRGGGPRRTLRRVGSSLRLGPLAVGAFACAALLASSPAAYAAASARLVYVRGPGAERCAGEPALRAAVLARLGYDPFFAWAPDTLFAEVRLRGGRYHAVVELVDRDNLLKGSRELSMKADDCSAMVNVMALTISLTLDPSSLVGRGDAPAPQASAEEPAPPAPEPPPPPVALARPVASTPALSPPQPEAPRPRGDGAPELWSLHLGLGAMGSMGVAAAPAFGTTASVGLAWRWLSLELEGRFDLPSTGRGSSSQVAEVQTWLFAGSVLPCAHWRWAFGCGVLAIGEIRASGEHVAQPTVRYGPWSAAGARIGAEWHPSQSRFFFDLYAEGLGTLTRDTFWVDQTPVLQVAPWSADVGLAAHVRL